jgi:hypothetical protein
MPSGLPSARGLLGGAPQEPDELVPAVTEAVLVDVDLDLATQGDEDVEIPKLLVLTLADSTKSGERVLGAVPNRVAQGVNERHEQTLGSAPLEHLAAADQPIRIVLDDRIEVAASRHLRRPLAIVVKRLLDEHVVLGVKGVDQVGDGLLDNRDTEYVTNLLGEAALADGLEDEHEILIRELGKHRAEHVSKHVTVEGPSLNVGRIGSDRNIRHCLSPPQSCLAG